ncbi:hypothetical protein ColLi_07498 [Colletotrichum liriopes]|uniref:Peptidase A1 domain-containing protein n=1 Tax=Colletotrichum liriopes TaxID=708192 RepID=A0AA37GPY1_9PEZI|nr:hypothetical protein ColLi_07498 [Colletotrichum liriopes]
MASSASDPQLLAFFRREQRLLFDVVWNLAQNGNVPEALFSIYLNSGRGSASGELTLGGVNADYYEGDIRK